MHLVGQHNIKKSVDRISEVKNLGDIGFLTLEQTNRGINHMFLLLASAEVSVVSQFMDLCTAFFQRSKRDSLSVEKEPDKLALKLHLQPGSIHTVPPSSPSGFICGWYVVDVLTGRWSTLRSHTFTPSAAPAAMAAPRAVVSGMAGFTGQRVKRQRTSSSRC